MKSRFILPLENRLNPDEDDDLFYTMNSEEKFELLSKYSEALTAAEDEIESKSPIFTLEQFKRFQEAYSDSVIEMIGITFDNDEVIEGEEYV